MHYISEWIHVCTIKCLSTRFQYSSIPLVSQYSSTCTMVLSMYKIHSLENVSDPFYDEPKTGKRYQFLRLSRSTKETIITLSRVLLSSALFYADQRIL